MRLRNSCVLAIVALVACAVAGTAWAGTIPFSDDFNGSTVNAYWKTLHGDAPTVSDGELHLRTTSPAVDMTAVRGDAAGVGNYLATDNITVTFKLGATAGACWMGLAGGGYAGDVPLAQVLNVGNGYYLNVADGKGTNYHGHNAGGYAYRQWNQGDLVSVTWTPTGVSATWNGELIGKCTTAKLGGTTTMQVAILLGNPNAVSFDSITVSGVPEPSSLVALLTAGLTGLVCYAWRKRK